MLRNTGFIDHRPSTGGFYGPGGLGTLNKAWFLIWGDRETWGSGKEGKATCDAQGIRRALGFAGL